MRTAYAHIIAERDGVGEGDGTPESENDATCGPQFKHPDPEVDIHGRNRSHERERQPIAQIRKLGGESEDASES